MSKTSSYYLYILQLSNGRLYTGVTSSIPRRELEHRYGKAGKTSKTAGAEEMIYTEKHPSKTAALKREQQIKSWTRAKKLALAQGDIKKLKHLSKRTS